jgi:hypothetical protein
MLKFLIEFLGYRIAMILVFGAVLGLVYVFGYLIPSNLPSCIIVC